MPQDPSFNQFKDYLWNTDFQEFNKTFQVNSSAVYFSVIAFLELLAEGNKKKNVEQLSQFIAVSSIGGYNRMPFAGFAYAASKAGTTHMMKQFATSFVPYDIRANVIAPGSAYLSSIPHYFRGPNAKRKSSISFRDDGGTTYGECEGTWDSENHDPVAENGIS
jgi:NAD(P)-dependent dehydrogenase (short-subunit alcohol dehydrogenase family)